MKHVMIDLETMSTRADAAIVSIGAVAFEVVDRPNDITDMDFYGLVEQDMLGEEFYVNVDLQSCIDAGLAVDAGTIYWWLQQSEAARNALLDTTKPRLHLHRALQAFSDFFNKVGAEFLWAHGTSFDIAILGNAYLKSHIKNTPWIYNKVRDTRGLYDMFEAWPQKNVGTAHNALDDAKSQAIAVVAAYQKFLEMRCPTEVAQVRAEIKETYDSLLRERKASGFEDPADSILEFLNSPAGQSQMKQGNDIMKDLPFVPASEPSLVYNRSADADHIERVVSKLSGEHGIVRPTDGQGTFSDERGGSVDPTPHTENFS